MQLQWIIRSFHVFQAFDEFVVGHFRLRLMGIHLTVEAEEVGESPELRSAASDLAYRYFAVLRKHVPLIMNLLTLEEYANILPPFSQCFEFEGSTTLEPKMLSDGVRLTRDEILASSDPHLRQSYDYLELAREDETNRLFHLYKFVETLEDSFSGEANLIKELDVKTAVKTLKRLANDRQHDQRHSRNVSGKSIRISSENQNLAMNYAYEIIRAYERSL